MFCGLTKETMCIFLKIKESDEQLIKINQIYWSIISLICVV